jgi:serine/threonine protein kinase
MSRAKLISSRLLATEDGIEYWSCLYDDGKVISKQATLDLAQREASFLSDLKSDYFPKVLKSWSEHKYSVVVLEKILGEPLERVAGDINEHPEEMYHFIENCLNILFELKQKGIVHRDIRLDNILMRDGKPVLLDFGWAVSEKQPYYIPKGLGVSERPPDGSFCNVYSMGKVLERVNRGRYHKFADVIKLMTEPDAYLRMTNLLILKLLFALAYKKESQHE